MSLELEVLTVWTWAAMKIKGGQHAKWAAKPLVGPHLI